MLKIEIMKFQAQDVITTSDAAPVEQKCICPTDGSHKCSNNVHYGPNGEPCPGTPYTYESGKTIYTHGCIVN